MDGHSHGGTDTDSEKTGASRRRWLALCAGASVGLAGCLDALDEDDESTDIDGEDDETVDAEGDDGSEYETDDGDSGDNEADREEAQERYEAAISALTENAETLERLAQEDVNPTQSDVDGIESRLDEAESALDEAEEMADDRLETELDAARDIAALQRALARSYQSAVEFETALETGFAYWETLELDRATEEFERAGDAVGDAIDRLEAAHDVHAEITHDVVEADELDYSGEFWEHVNPDGVAELEVFEEFVAGLGEFTVALALSLDGIDAFEREEYGQAHERFEAADAEIDATLRTFREIEDDPETPDDLRPSIISFRGEVEEWEEALEYFTAAASAGEDGDVEAAVELFEEGSQALPE